MYDDGDKQEHDQISYVGKALTGIYMFGYQRLDPASSSRGNLVCTYGVSKPWGIRKAGNKDHNRQN